VLVALVRLFLARSDRSRGSGSSPPPATDDKVPAAAALAAVAAMLAAGLFEYNFGDSEFLMLFLVLVTLPFAAARDEHATASARA
jgi:hypothetical protein